MILPSPFPSPYTKVLPSLSLQCHFLFSRFLNCMQKAVTSVLLSWDVQKTQTYTTCPLQ